MNYKQFFKNHFSLNFWLVTILAGITLVSLLIGLVTSARTNIFLNKEITEAQEAARPAEIEIVIITDPSCADCFNLDQLIEAIKQQNVEIVNKEELSLDDEKAQGLIKQFNITKAPSLLIKGELNKNEALKAWLNKLGKIENETFVLAQVGAPYVLLSSGEVKGRMEIIMLTDSSCSECYQVTNHEKILNSFGIATQNKKIIDAQDSQGKDLIWKYRIKLLPTIILTGDFEAYPALAEVWPKVGTVEQDGTYIFRQGVQQMGVYKDLSAGRIVK